MKKCSKCKILLNLSDFYIQKYNEKTNKTIYFGACKKCTSDNQSKYYHENFRKIQKTVREKRKTERFQGWRIKHKLSNYGITLEQYNEMLLEQKHLCFICKKEPGGKHKKLCIDHNHKTNCIRKLLCNKCNTVLGLVYEDKEILKTMILYLENHNDQI